MFYTDVKSPPIESGTQRTLVTAAHLGEVDGYTQVYVDKDTDFAIYVKEDYIAEGLSLSDVVSLAGTTGTVSSVSRQEFSVVVDDISKIVPGVSGEPVYLNNTPHWIHQWMGWAWFVEMHLFTRGYPLGLHYFGHCHRNHADCP